MEFLEEIVGNKILGKDWAVWNIAITVTLCSGEG